MTSSPRVAARAAPRLLPLHLPIAVSLGAVAALYRFISFPGFSNDHYVHLVRAQAMLLGDLPIRDYTEEGVPLWVLLSATFQKILGAGLLAELSFVLLSLGVAAGVTYWVAFRLTRSVGLGVLAASLQIITGPRLYGYPKMLLYPVLVLLAMRYVERPIRSRLAVLAGWTAIGFLVRHDHGVYLAIGGLAACIAAHWKDDARQIAGAVLWYVATGLLIVTPYLLYVQRQIGVFDYFRLGAAISAYEPSEPFAFPDFDRWTPGSPIIITRLEPSNEDLPAIHVRWRPSVDATARARLEQDLKLLLPVPHDDARTFRYHVDPDDTATLGRLASAPDVEDVDGFDRRALTVADAGGLTGRLQRGIGRYRLHLGPALTSLVTTRNAVGALFLGVRVLPVLAFVIWWRRRGRLSDPDSSALVPALCLLVFVCALALARAPEGHRVADTFGSVPLLAVWLVAAVTESRTRPHATAVARFALSLPLLLAVALQGDLFQSLNRANVQKGLPATLGHARTVLTMATDWPWPLFWPSGDDWKVAEYVHDCTAPNDRLLLTFFAPEYNFVSGRGFAGGESTLMPARRSTDSYEEQVLTRLAAQRVPIVLGERGQDEMFRQSYPRLSAYLDRTYSVAGEGDFGPRHQILVRVDSRLQKTGVDAMFGFPCFVPH